jgi:hypothetical protein
MYDASGVGLFLLFQWEFSRHGDIVESSCNYDNVIKEVS